MINSFIFLILIFIVGYLYWYKYGKSKKLEHLNTFNGRTAINDQYFYDKLFDDVYYYPNTYQKNYSNRKEEIGKLLKTGWVRCKEECPGHCVEYGVGGASYCFPY